MIASGGGRGIDTHCFREFGCFCCCSAVVAFLVLAFADFLLPDDGVEDDLVTREVESLTPFVGSLVALLVELGLVALFFEVRFVVVVVVAVLCSLVALDPSVIVTLGVPEDFALDFPLDLDSEGVSRWMSLGERWVTGHCCVCS